MYEAFDSFLRIQTWYTTHEADQQRFFCALRSVVNNEGFAPDELGRYMDRKRNEEDPALANLTDDAYNEARDYYVAAAWAVKRYLEANCA